MFGGMARISHRLVGDLEVCALFKLTFLRLIYPYDGCELFVMCYRYRELEAWPLVLDMAVPFLVLVLHTGLYCWPLI